MIRSTKNRAYKTLIFPVTDLLPGDLWYREWASGKRTWHMVISVKDVYDWVNDKKVELYELSTQTHSKEFISGITGEYLYRNGVMIFAYDGNIKND